MTFADGDHADDNVDALEARLSTSPDDLDTRLSLAKKYVSKKQFEPALQHLLDIIRTDRRFRDDAGRKTMLAVFELLGNEHPLTCQYRRLLAATLN